MKTLVIGTRGSKLALTQTHGIANQLRRLYPSMNISIEIIKTTGDKLTTASLVRLAGESKGLFVKEIEEALLAGKIDLAVHSLKDLPTEIPDDLTVGAVPEREDPRDALISPHKIDSVSDLPTAAKVATSSLRRRVQLQAVRPDLQITEIRGNVDTRLRKMKEQHLDGIILATAGLRRLGLERTISYKFSAEEMIPAIGQGALAIEVRKLDSEVLEILRPIDHEPTRETVTAERFFLAALGGGCQVPMGAHGRAAENESRFSAFICDPSGKNMIKREFVSADGPLMPLAEEAADYFRERGAESILKEVESP